MGNEMSKAFKRRQWDWRYANRWFKGTGLDIGCGYDTMVGCVGYDHVNGDKDAQTLPEIADNTYDFVVSSHCLEHMHNPITAMLHWLRVVKQGGFVTVTIPEWTLYERRHWPSKGNGDHKWAWSMQQDAIDTEEEHVIYLPTFLAKLHMEAEFDIEMMQLMTEHWVEGLDIDQSGGSAEVAIEFVLRKT